MEEINAKLSTNTGIELINSGVLLEQLNEGVLCLDTNGIIRFANSKYLEVSGFAKEELLGKRVFDILHIRNSNIPISRVYEEKRKGNSILFEIEQRIKDGTKKWFRISSSPIANDEGGLLGTVEIYREITDQKLAENLLQESENRFRNLADITPVLIWMSDIDDDFYYFNKAWLDFTGRTIEDELGSGWSESIHPDDIEEFNIRIRKNIKKREIFKIEHRLKRSDGEFRWMLSIGRPRYLTDGRFAGYIGSSIDISFIKNVQEELERQASELKRSNEDLEQFAYVASHDLQEPLRMISSYVQIIQQKLAEQNILDLDDYMEYAIDGVRRMQALINDLLNYSRVKRQGRPFELIDCNNIVESVEEILMKLIEENKAKIEFKNLPIIKADKSQITRLFQNLIENCIKFKSDQPPRIEIDCKEEKDHFVFSLSDNGIGIEEKFFERIFVIFQRLHSRKDYKGTGIGLSICKRIVERHEGSIWVESKNREGTTFYFTLKKQ